MKHRDRTIQLERRAFPGAEPNEALTIEVGYQMGGINYFTYQTEKRGYYVTVRPEVIEERSRRFIVGDGTKRLLLEAARYSDKGLEASTKLATAEAVEPLITYVLAKRAERQARRAS